MEAVVALIAGAIAILTSLWHVVRAIARAVRHTEERFRRIERQIGLRPWRNHRK